MLNIYKLKNGLLLVNLPKINNSTHVIEPGFEDAINRFYYFIDVLFIDYVNINKSFLVFFYVFYNVFGFPYVISNGIFRSNT